MKHLYLLALAGFAVSGCASEIGDEASEESAELVAPIAPRENPRPVPWLAPVKVFKQPASVVNDVPEAPSGGGTKNESEE